MKVGGGRADEWAASSASGVLLPGACEPVLREEALGARVPGARWPDRKAAVGAELRLELSGAGRLESRSSLLPLRSATAV